MLNIFALSNTEKNKRLRFRCIHRHNGISHSNCFEQANNLKERVGFFDIETSNLNANWGIILSYCILGEDKLYKGLITPEDLTSGVFDLNICKKFCEDVRNFDRIIGWYSAKFDGPFLRTRCMYHKLDFPVFKEIKHTDAWFVAKKKLKLHSNRLGVVAPFLGIRAKDHPINPSIWLQCLSGNKEALDFVMVHNEEDVNSLKAVWNRFEEYIRLTNTSL